MAQLPNGNHFTSTLSPSNIPATTLNLNLPDHPLNGNMTAQGTSSMQETVWKAKPPDEPPLFLPDNDVPDLLGDSLMINADDVDESDPKLASLMMDRMRSPQPESPPQHDMSLSGNPNPTSHALLSSLHPVAKVPQNTASPLALQDPWNTDVIVQNVNKLDNLLALQGLHPFGTSLKSLVSPLDIIAPLPPLDLGPYTAYGILDIPSSIAQNQLVKKLYGAGAADLGKEHAMPRDPSKARFLVLPVKRQSSQQTSKDVSEPPGGRVGLIEAKHGRGARRDLAGSGRSRLMASTRLQTPESTISFSSQEPVAPHSVGKKRKRDEEEEEEEGPEDRKLARWALELQKLVKGKGKSAVTEADMRGFSQILVQIESVAEQLDFATLVKSDLGRTISLLSRMDDVPWNDANNLVPRAKRLNSSWNARFRA